MSVNLIAQQIDWKKAIITIDGGHWKRCKKSIRKFLIYFGFVPLNGAKRTRRTNVIEITYNCILKWKIAKITQIKRNPNLHKRFCFYLAYTDYPINVLSYSVFYTHESISLQIFLLHFHNVLNTKIIFHFNRVVRTTEQRSRAYFTLEIAHKLWTKYWSPCPVLRNYPNK